MQLKGKNSNILQYLNILMGTNGKVTFLFVYFFTSTVNQDSAYTIGNAGVFTHKFYSVNS